MADKNLELALRIRTDLQQGKRELDDFGKTVENVGKKADGAGAGTDKLGSSAQRLIQDIREYEDALSQTALTQDEMAAQEERLDRLMAAGAISVKEYDKALEHLDKTESGLVKQHQQQDRALQSALRTADRTAAELKKLDGVERQVTEAFKSGRISATEYDRAIQNIGRRRQELEATRGTIGKLGLTSRDTRGQIITLLRSLSTGNFDTVAFDVARLGSSVDKSGLALARMIIPLGSAVALLGGFTAVTYAAWKEQRELFNAISLTGNFAGVTNDEIDALAGGLERYTEATIGQSREIVTALVATGRVSERMIDSYGRAIVRLQNLTGRSTEELVKMFVDMQDGVAESAMELNRTMHFLTAAQLENIRVLEERGDTEQAIQIALDELGKKEVQRLGYVERAWKRVTEAASTYRDLILEIGRPDTLQDQIEEIAQRFADLQAAAQGNVIARLKRGELFALSPEEYEAERQALLAQYNDLIGLRREQETQANAQSEEARRQQAAAEAQARVRDMTLRLDHERQMQMELDKLRRDFQAGRDAGLTDGDFSDANLKRLQEEIRERFADPAVAQRAKAAEDYVTQLEAQAAAIGKTASQLRLQASREQALNVEQRDRANAALWLLKLEEERQQVARDQQQIDQLRIQLLRAQGREAEAAAAEIEQRFGELQTRLRERGEDDDAAIIDALLDLEALQQRLVDAETMIEEVLVRQQRREQNVTADREAGLITEAEARRNIIEIHKETYAELLKQKELLEEIAKQPGIVGENARKALDQLQHQSNELQRTVTLFEATLRTSVESGLTKALEGLAKGTLSFRDAIRELARTVADAVIRLRAEEIAGKITRGIFDRDTSGGGSGGFFSSLKSLFGLSGGGRVRGRGTGTSDDNLRFLSDDEFVTRSQVVRQPGALDFLQDFNARGMAALKDWGMRMKPNGTFALDSSALPPAPQMPAPIGAKGQLPEPAKAFSAELRQTQNFYLVDDENRIADIMAGPKGQKAVAIAISRDPSKFRSILGGGKK